MTAVRLRRGRIVAVFGAIAAISVLCGVAVGSCSSSARSSPARTAAQRFLSRYVDPSGRVVRHDQGGDTVSEGQAYAMLLAAAIGERGEFERVWGWTRKHLQRGDRLLSFHWSGGRVIGADPAADADLDAAWALVVASRRFDSHAYRRQAAELGRAILREETAPVPGGRVLVAGPWARAAPYTVDPSYFSPAAFEALARTGHAHAWRELAHTSYSVLREARGGNPPLPPDWAKVGTSGAAGASRAPGGASGRPAGMQYGLDAARVPVRMAAGCDPRARQIAAAMWPFLRRATAGGRDPALAYDLSGRPLAPTTNPVTLVAAAGAADAAGDHAASGALLARAEALDQRHPTYYGAAWVALGRVVLGTRLLGSCAIG